MPWGRHIRAYVIDPTPRVKDLRTGIETSDVRGVLDGDLDQFMRAALAMRFPRPARRNDWAVVPEKA